MQTRGEIRSNVASTTRETGINNLINDYINITLQEIQNPAWAFREDFHHYWSFLRRKTTFDTVASTEFYQLPRDVDKIGLIRQTTSPSTLKYVTDELFYKLIPNPTATGNPHYYRIWEDEGVATSLTTADTIDVVSSSTSDSSTITLKVVGKSNGIITSEEYTLNGTTTVTGSTTFDANYPIRVSKSGQTTGTITVTENSGGTTLVTLGAEERAPRFKVMGMYPIPSSAITMYLEYYTRLRLLNADADVPDIPEQFMFVVRLGTLAKVYQYKDPTSNQTLATLAQYKDAVRAMVQNDMSLPDHFPSLLNHNKTTRRVGIVEIADDIYTPVH